MVLCGDSFYSELGVTWNAKTLDDLDNMVRQILNGGMTLYDNQIVDDFLYFYVNHFLVDRSEKALAFSINRFLGGRGFSVGKTVV